MAGQNLIRAAELRAISTEYEKHVTAFRTFQDKYFAIPGDFRDATKFWGRLQTGAGCNTNSAAAVASPGACDGDGDGALEISSANNISEGFSAWQQLAHAGLVEGSYTAITGSASAFDADVGTNVPTSKLGQAGWTWGYASFVPVSNTIRFEGSYGNLLMFGNDTDYESYGFALTPEEAWNVDTKMDDGRPGLGKVRTFESFSVCHDQTPSTSANLASVAQYRVNNPGTFCGLMFLVN